MPDEDIKVLTRSENVKSQSKKCKKIVAKNVTGGCM